MAGADLGQADAMTVDTQEATIGIVQMKADNKWRIMIRYDNGEFFLSSAFWATEADAKRAAIAWTFDNMVLDDTVPQ